MELNTKPIILVDLDGVLANFELACLEAWQREYPSLPYIELENRCHWDVRMDYRALDSSYEGLMKDLMREKDFYLNLPIIDGAKEAMEEMLAANYEVLICTTPSRINLKCTTEKSEWVVKMLGPHWVERIIFTRDKTMVRGDILIDDKPVICGLLTPTFTHVLFDWAYNREQDKPRIKEWKNWRQTVDSVLETRVSRQSDTKTDVAKQLLDQWVESDQVRINTIDLLNNQIKEKEKTICSLLEKMNHL